MDLLFELDFGGALQGLDKYVPLPFQLLRILRNLVLAAPAFEKVRTGRLYTRRGSRIDFG
jgi:hypothetical protein